MNTSNTQYTKVETPGERTAFSRRAIGALALSMLLSSLGTSIANVALPTLATAFAVTVQDVQWIVLAYLLAITVLIVSAGRLGDIVGHRRLLLAGIALFTVASVLCSMAPTLAMLIAARALQGLGGATLMAIAVALVREVVPRESTGRAMGWLGTTSAIGTALGPSLGGMLLEGQGWRSIFVIMVPIGILNFLLAWRCLPVAKQRKKFNWHELDRAGTLLLGATLVAYALAMTTGRGQWDTGTTVLLIGAALGAGLFVQAQTKTRSPLIRLETLRNPSLSAGLIMNVLVSIVMMTTLVVGPFYLAQGLKLGGAQIGMVMSIGPVIAALSGVPAGRLVDRFGSSIIVLFGLIGMVTGGVALALLPSAHGVTGYVLAMAILTPGYQLFLAANNTAVMTDVPQNQRGVLSGMLNLSRNLGLITGASAMGAVFAIVSSGNSTVSRALAVTAGMQVTFAIAAALAALAIAVFAASRIIARRSASLEA